MHLLLHYAASVFHTYQRKQTSQSALITRCNSVKKGCRFCFVSAFPDISMMCDAVCILPTFKQPVHFARKHGELPFFFVAKDDLVR